MGTTWIPQMHVGQGSMYGIGDYIGFIPVLISWHNCPGDIRTAGIEYFFIIMQIVVPFADFLQIGWTVFPAFFRIL
ncbi:MAG: hypothetical protein AA908_11170 [Chlorobi bacterium NICIL-2]|nr:MAG: hypothetical protein AA908_11170 [Chlorobi bacterium NICIL-2]